MRRLDGYEVDENNKDIETPAPNEIDDESKEKLKPHDKTENLYRDDKIDKKESKTEKLPPINYTIDRRPLTDNERKEWMDLDTNTIDEKYLNKAADNNGHRLTVDEIKKDDYNKPFGNQEDTNGLFNPDAWKPGEVKKGDTIYQLSEDGNTQSSYFTDKSTVDSCRNEDGKINYDKLKDALQINDPNNNKMHLTAYKANDNIPAAEGRTNENPEYGHGQGKQYFIPYANEHKNNDTLERIPDEDL